MTHKRARPQTDREREREQDSGNTKEKHTTQHTQSRRDRKGEAEKDREGESRHHRTPEEPSLVSPHANSLIYIFIVLEPAATYMSTRQWTRTKLTIRVEGQPFSGPAFVCRFSHRIRNQPPPTCPPGNGHEPC